MLRRKETRGIENLRAVFFSSKCSFITSREEIKQAMHIDIKLNSIHSCWAIRINTKLTIIKIIMTKYNKFQGWDEGKACTANAVLLYSLLTMQRCKPTTNYIHVNNHSRLNVCSQVRNRHMCRKPADRRKWRERNFILLCPKANTPLQHYLHLLPKPFFASSQELGFFCLSWMHTYKFHFNFFCCFLDLFTQNLPSLDYYYC